MALLNPWKTSPDHEALFIERYDKLLVWAFALTENDEQLAEDLVHDAFIQFTFNPPDLQGIHNVEAYLYGILRHLHLSHVRRAAQRHLQQFSIVDCDSAESSLRMIDPRDQIQIQDELRQVCHYACFRKESAKAASVLILRFFHGYYPSEIAQLLRNSMQTVKVWLRTARGEARLNLESPAALGFISDTANVKLLPSAFARPADDLLNELRQTIFGHLRGECLTKKQLQAIYGGENSAALGCKELAHIVSCEHCLTTVNGLLGLPQLSDRYPADTAGKEGRKKKGGPDGGSGPGGGMRGGVTGDRATNKSRRRVREVFEHYPQELCVSVNGYIQGSQIISSETSELTLTVHQDERISFVEVFSGPRTRLLLMSVDEQPPEGPIQQTAKIKLSEERTIEVRLKFSSPWPILEMTYSDPSFVPDYLTKNREAEIGEATANGDYSAEADQPIEPQKPLSSLRKWFNSRLPSFDRRLFLRLGAVTVVALVLIAVALFVEFRRSPKPPASAVALLSQSSAAEDAIAARIDQVLHRTITLEERELAQASGLSGEGNVVARRRIEIWHSVEKGVTARRLFDEKGYLLSGQWINRDGSSTFYNHGRPQVQSKGYASLPFGLDSAWQLEPSAKGFVALVEESQSSIVQETPTSYVIDSEPQASEVGGQALVKATLTLSRADLHATELRLVVRNGNSNPESATRNTKFREYRFIEASFERRAPSTVAPSVFEPDPELVKGATEKVRTEEKETLLAGPVPSAASSRVLATPELEVEVLNLLSQAGADLDEQTSVTRTSDGKLRVGGLVETEKRKEEILRSLRLVADNPAVHIQIETVAEAAKRQARSGSSSLPITVERVEVEKSIIPTYSDIRRHVASDEEVGRFAARMVRRSSEAMSHAAVLRRLLKQFSPGDLRALSPEARTKWAGMIRAHARAFQRQMAALVQDLQLIIPQQGGGNAQAEFDAIASDKDLSTAVERLYALGVANDQVVRSAFTTSSVVGAVSSIKTPQFWQSVRLAEALAVQISRQ